MAGGDRTGPQGLGPMTGRAAGICAGYNRPGYENSTYRRRRFLNGFGRLGGGRGRGFRNNGNGMFMDNIPGNWQSTTPIEDSAEILKAQARYLQEDLDIINMRIQEQEKLDK